MEAFRRLGDGLAQAWARRDYDEAAFPALAVAALTEARLHEGFEPLAVLRDLVVGAPVIDQGPGDFGEPPVCVYRGRGFYIEVLFWLDGTTTIHEHAFSGAFQVLAGASVHAVHSFRQDVRVRSTLRLGEVTCGEVELLRRGAVRPIVAGPGFIHALFHLERPSVSVVVRTLNEHDRLPQMNYLPPGIGFDPFEVDRLRDRRLQALGLLAACDRPALHALLEDIARDADLPTVFHALNRVATPFHDVAALTHYVALAEARHGERAARLLPALLEQVRRLHLTERRAAVQDAGQRYFLALLLNVPRKNDVLRLVAEVGPPDPAAAVLEWVRALARLRDERTTTVLDLTFSHDPGGSERCVTILLATLGALLDGGGAEAACARAAAALGELAPDDEAGIDALVATLAGPTSPFAVLAR